MTHSFSYLVDLLQKEYDSNISQKLLYLCLGGSRLYGTATESSDWDYIAVTSQKTTNLVNPSPSAEMTEYNLKDYRFTVEYEIDVYTCQSQAINITFYSEEYFTLLLRSHNIGVLECLYRPREYVLLNKLQISSWKLDIDVLKRSLIWQSKRELIVARKKLREGKVRKAKKLLFLSIRTLLYGLDLIKDHQITNYECANALWDEINNSPQNNWKNLYSPFKLIHKNYEKEFKLQNRFYGFNSTLEMYEKIHEALIRWHNLDVPLIPNQITVVEDSPLKMEIMRDNFDLRNILKRYQLQFARHPDYHQLVTLSHTPFTPMNALTRMCHGITLDMNNLKIVSQGDDVPLQYFEDIQLDFDWTKPFSTFEALDGHTAFLYYYGNRWQLGTEYTPDGSETIAYKTEDGTAPSCHSFSKRFWMLYKKRYKLPEETTRCFIFKMQLPEFRRVVHYYAPDIIYCCSRDMNTMKLDHTTTFATKYGWSMVMRYPDLKDKDSIAQITKELNPFLQMGFIVVDETGKKVLFKNSKHFCVDISIDFQNNINPLNITAEYFHKDCLLDLWRLNKVEEFCNHFPKWREIVEGTFSKQYRTVTARLSQLFSKYSDQKYETNHDLFVTELRNQEEDLYSAILLAWKKESFLYEPNYFLAVLPRKTWKALLKLSKKESLRPISN
eukprot:TRINITY_DN1843_c0_g1_i2.p1 TRINITY_DN1843_c0_g1~~TRINITY_DN1843_c0_g1_i2.p1  ORF type:complete len:668 (-),score=122.65 TRINITY_DN1843_c0_g1_i2:1069-3072(-)